MDKNVVDYGRTVERNVQPGEGCGARAFITLELVRRGSIDALWLSPAVKIRDLLRLGVHLTRALDQV